MLSFLYFIFIFASLAPRSMPIGSMFTEIACVCALPNARYHRWSRYCVKISKDESQRELTVVSRATSTAWERRWHHQRRITQEYATVQIAWSRPSLLRRPLRMARSRRPARRMIRAPTDRRRNWAAPTAASSFPTRHSTFCTKVATANQTRGSATSVPRHARMFTSSIRIC